MTRCSRLGGAYDRQDLGGVSRHAWSLLAVRIAINASIVDPFLSGLGIYTVSLTRELAALHKDIVVYTADAERCGVPPARCRRVSRGVQPRWGGMGHLRRLLWLQTALPLRLVLDRAAVLLSPVPEGLLLPLVPQVVVVHDVLPLRFPQEYPRQQHYFRHLVPAVLRRARAVIAVSDSTKRDLVACYGLAPATIHVVPNGCDGQRFHPGIAPEAVARKYQLGAYLLYVGNLLPHKNLPTLLRAFAAVAGRVPHRLVIAGKKDPRYYPSLQAMAGALGLAERVLFLDYVPAEELPALYAGAAACILPSLYEGFGLPVLEAMACGTPVIAARRGALCEVAGEAAAWVEPSDAEAMAHAIEAVLQDPGLRRSLRAKGLQRAAAFSWRRTATMVLAILERATAR
jgi:glycosyltransferase involved in cell wall biosynthesis